ncbi:replication initiation factor domain-containing protein [Microcoleus sp. S36b_A4]|uniref:replication initiation factor domain-containing protein n=1 Tax=Microcoleus sp. S36b_A4 TaxID=3055420 RepID=UPI002FD54D1C
MEHLPRNISIDWLRFQVLSYRPSILKQIQEIIGLPFEKKEQQSKDPRDTNFMFANKIWHEAYEFQGSLMAMRYPASGAFDEPYAYYVDLKGSLVSTLNFHQVSELLYSCQFELEFIANRIDIALDFPLGVPRLSMRNWESFVEDGLLFGYRTVRRISNTGSTKDFTTVYLGSRESSRFVRIYEKNINGIDYDRLEVEFKRDRAESIMKELANCSVSDFPEFLNGFVFGELKFVRQRQDVEFFKRYIYGPITVPRPILHLDIEKSILFIGRHCATLAMLQEFMGVECFDKFIQSQLAAGKLRMKPRHRTILENAKFLGVTALGLFLILAQTPGAIASGLSCPAPVPLSFQMSQKFPIDIVNPTAAEQAYFDNIGDGCFQISSGLEFQQLCLPGMIVNALKPFVIMGLGIKFIFSD